jgi:hypothetical protein
MVLGVSTLPMIIQPTSRIQIFTLICKAKYEFMQEAKLVVQN